MIVAGCRDAEFRLLAQLCLLRRRIAECQNIALIAGLMREVAAVNRRLAMVRESKGERAQA